MFSALFISALLSLVGVAVDSDPLHDGNADTTHVHRLPPPPESPAAPGDRIIEMIPESETGTGYPEVIEYQLPASYNPNGTGHPMVVCWHGANQSCMSVAFESLIDEECLARDWFYLSITGAFEAHYGNLIAQTHCTVAIRHLVETLDFNIDTDRIYMAGLDMGAFGAASYASRHLSFDEGYPVAGLMLVAPWYDITDLYYNAPSIQPVLIQMLGGTPQEVPFAYQQLSTLFIENSTYVLEKSMGQNLRHNAPVHISYAGNHPMPFITVQNEIFRQMLDDLDANVVVDYEAMSMIPISWALLDEKAAMDLMAMYSLKTQCTDSIHIVADRNTWFYWMKPDEIEKNTFSLFQGSMDAEADTLEILEATSTGVLSVDSEKLRPHEQNLWITFESTFPDMQVLKIGSMDTEPTYVVDEQGKLYPGWSYAPETLTLMRPANASLNVKASFEAYNLTLTAHPEIVHKNDPLSLHFSGGDAHDLFALFTAIAQQETKVGIHHLLVDLQFPTIFWVYNLDAWGNLILADPSTDPALVGYTFYLQFLTYENGIKELSNLATVQVVE